MDWETLNTQKIKAVFYTYRRSAVDFGTKIRFKCHRPIQPKERTRGGQLCTNWKLIDSFGVRLPENDYYTYDSRYESGHYGPSYYGSSYYGSSDYGPSYYESSYSYELSDDSINHTDAFYDDIYKKFYTDPDDNDVDEDSRESWEYLGKGL